MWKKENLGASRCQESYFLVVQGESGVEKKKTRGCLSVYTEYMEDRNHLEEIAKELHLIREALERIVVGMERAVPGAEISSLDDDELYEQAEKVVRAAGKASTSFLQRKFSIGYARAAALIDALEERGVIGPANGALPRMVYTQITPEMKNILQHIEDQLKEKNVKKGKKRKKQ